MTWNEKLEKLELISKRLSFSEEANTALTQMISDIHNAHAAEIDVLQRAAIKKDRQVDAHLKLVKEVVTRSRQKLMAIFYLLDVLKTCGTHHEKYVTLTHLMATIERMVNSEASELSYSDDDLLPF